MSQFLRLDTKLKLTKELVSAANVAEKFSGDDLSKIGQFVMDGWKADEGSRSHWRKRMETAMNLAMQLAEAKSFPWPGASNVKFPLVTIAALQWHSRAYPTLVSGPDIVKMRVTAPDPSGALGLAADRIGKFMSYQLLEKDKCWEEETDRALLQLPLIGSVFKKTYYHKGECRSDVVFARDFAVSYYTKSLDACPRMTHIIPFSRNEIYERAMAEVWRKNVLEQSWYDAPATPRREFSDDDKRDRRTGLHQPSAPDTAAPYHFLEQYLYMDLDQDGYAEPWIATVHEGTGWVVRLTAGFEWDNIAWIDKNNRDKSAVLSIKREQPFSKYPFMPSPDGGFYEMGFGVLLGPLNASVDTMINQLIDAGTLAVTAGGFLGKGVKIRGGEQSFRPFGWLRVDSTGEDLAKGIFPAPVREPSMVLFQLLSLLIDYTNRISGSTDIMVGVSPGQNTPAETSRMMAEQGMKINAAIFKRVWRGMKSEFEKVYDVNRKIIPVTGMTYGENGQKIMREDFSLPTDAIRPAADPNLSSETVRSQQAMMIAERARMVPGYNTDEVERNLLRQMRVENAEKLFTGTAGKPPPIPPKVQEIQAKGVNEQQKIKMNAENKLRERMLDAKLDSDKTQAEIAKLRAETAAIIAQLGEAQAARQVAAFEAQISALEKVHTSQQEYLRLAMEAQALDNESAENQEGTVSGVAQPSGD